MTTITLKGREIPLLYTVYEMKSIQEDICPLDDLFYQVMGTTREDPKSREKFGTPDHLDTVAKLVRILGNAGLEEAGENPDLTEKRILRAIRPGDIADIVTACAQAITEGVESEIKDPGDSEPKDVVLEEINKKKETAS